MSYGKLKILLLGSNSKVNQEFFLKYIRSKFVPSYKQIVGVDILTTEVEFEPGKNMTLSIWDIGGKNRFNFIQTSFYKGAAGAFIVFDLTRAQAYKEAKKILIEVQQFAGDIHFVLIGYKTDLKEGIDIVIDRDDAREFAEKNGGNYVEIPLKTGVNFHDVLTEFTRRIIMSRA